MAEQLKVIPVFIGSPGGLGDERRTARDIVDEINQSNSKHWGCQLELVGWEETLPGHGRPQDLINKDLDRCDYFIGVIHDHWGSKTSTGKSEFSSGFEEEFVRATKRVEVGEMKDRAVFFKAIPAERMKDAGPSLQKVLDFKAECFKKKDALYTEFNTHIEFSTLVRKKLMQIGWGEATLLKEEETKLDSPSSLIEPESDNKSTKIKSKLFEEEAITFLEGVLTHSSDMSKTSKYDIARFRLISSNLKFAGNDTKYLGPHDSNLLFKHRGKINFSKNEIRGLLKAGLNNLSHENIPVWSYVEKTLSGKKYSDLLDDCVLFGEDNVRSSAIKILNLLERDIPTYEEFIGLTEERVIEGWFNEERTVQEVEAALEYLSENGLERHIPVLDKVCEQVSPERKSKIVNSIIFIKTRLGENVALEFIFENEITDLSKSLCNKIFAKKSSLQTDFLMKFLTSGSKELRYKVVETLFERDALTEKDSAILIADSDYEIRLIAAITLLKLGNPLEDELVKKALTIKKPQNLGLFNSKTTDTKYYDTYNFQKLSNLDYSNLCDHIRPNTVFVDDVMAIIYQTYPKKKQDEIRQNLPDGFSGYFSELMKDMASYFNNDSSLDETRKLIPFISKRLTSAALKGLCSLKQKADINLIRKTIDQYEIEYSEEILHYFAKFGEWQDIARIAKLDDFQLFGRLSLLASRDKDKPRNKAKAIILIAGKRVADLLNVDCENQIKEQILGQLPPIKIKDISDEVIIDHLKSKTESLRKILALRCCECLPKKRIADILEKYHNSEGSHYYNAIHILDLGASLNKTLSKSIACKILASL